MSGLGDIGRLQDEISRFCEERGWAKYHNGKDLSAAIAIEAAELQDAFLWNRVPSHEKVSEELADVFIYALLMAEISNIDVERIVRDKLAANAIKYPVEKCRGSATKYTDL